jgi:hypothetical protein
MAAGARERGCGAAGAREEGATGACGEGRQAVAHGDSTAMRRATRGRARRRVHARGHGGGPRLESVARRAHARQRRGCGGRGRVRLSEAPKRRQRCIRSLAEPAMPQSSKAQLPLLVIDHDIAYLTSRHDAARGSTWPLELRCSKRCRGS